MRGSVLCAFLGDPISRGFEVGRARGVRGGGWHCAWKTFSVNKRVSIICAEQINGRAWGGMGEIERSAVVCRQVRST